MSIAQELDYFFRSTGQSVFIEAEGTPQKIQKFINNYNSSFRHSIDERENGIIVLEDDANKWALELRLYFVNREGIPNGVHITHTSVYRGEYPYRINNNKVIYDLFELGYCIGIN